MPCPPSHRFDHSGRNVKGSAIITQVTSVQKIDVKPQGQHTDKSHPLSRGKALLCVVACCVPPTMAHYHSHRCCLPDPVRTRLMISALWRGIGSWSRMNLSITPHLDNSCRCIFVRVESTLNEEWISLQLQLMISLSLTWYVPSLCAKCAAATSRAALTT